MKFWRYGCLLVLTILCFNGGAYSEDDDRETKPFEAPRNCCESLMKECTAKENMLLRELEEHRQKVAFSSQPPSCIPVFKSFLTKLLEEMEKIGLPHNVTAEMVSDAEVKPSKQLVAEIRTLVNSESGWGTGALDDAFKQISIKVKLHENKTWKSFFGDMFGVELEMVFKVSGVIFIIVARICIKMWSVGAWFIRFKRIFAICFFINLAWNWFCLYKIAFAEHQADIVKMDSMNDKCTGGKEIDWTHALKEWFRITGTHQDDPCQNYYEVLIVNPILLAPPQKALFMTLTTFIMDPLKHLAEAINQILKFFLEILLVPLQIPVFLVISLLGFAHKIGQASAHDPSPAVAQQPSDISYFKRILLGLLIKLNI